MCRQDQEYMYIYFVPYNTSDVEPMCSTIDIGFVVNGLIGVMK